MANTWCYTLEFYRTDRFQNQTRIAGTHSTRGAPGHPQWSCLLFQSSGPPLSVVRSSTVPNHRIFTYLKRQVFQETKRQLAAPLRQVIDRLLTKSQNTRWQRTALDVSPSQLWGHGHAVTEYQLWTRYRHATGQLNFWYPDRPPDGSCPYSECAGHKETQEHLFWACPRAQASWARLISY